MEIQNPFQIAWDRTPYQSFTEYFFGKIQAHGSNLAIMDVDTGKQWRYSEIRTWSEMCVKRLQELQVSSTSRVAVVTGTTGQAIFVHLACSIIGCPAIAINGWGTVDEIWQVVDIAEATHLIVEACFIQKGDDVRRKAIMRGGGRIRHVRIIDDVLTTEPISTDMRRKSVIGTPRPLMKEHSRAQLLPQPSEEREPDIISPLSDSYIQPKENGVEEPTTPKEIGLPLVPNTPQTPMLLFFTSGTTGAPKPAELSYRSLIINIQQISQPLYGPVQAKERFLLPLCISHIFGAISAYYALVNGATVYMVSRYYPKMLVEALCNLNICVCHVTPAMIMQLATEPTLENLKLPHLRSVLISGAPVDSNLAAVAKGRLGCKDMRQTYGMTELGGMCTMAPYESEKIETVGAPLPGMLFKVVNWETKLICTPRQPGQLLVMGPQAVPSYFKNAKATSEIVDMTGYIRTGDAAFYDEMGRLYILDRIKDIIKYKGTLVCPSEVELILRGHPGIDDCAVVGRQDHVAGEVVPAAFVVKNSNHPLLSSGEVRQYVAGKIPSFKELRGGVFFISEIPRSVCGKVLRRNLRQFWDRERNNTKADIASKDTKASKAANEKTPVKSGPARNGTVAKAVGNGGGTPKRGGPANTPKSPRRSVASSKSPARQSPARR